MGFLDWFFKPKKEVATANTQPRQSYPIPQRFCVGYSSKQQLNSVTEDGRRGVCPTCGKECRRTKAGTSYWHIPEQQW
jgi:hypothetical protein